VNRLGLETSPYLLQHADNPVDWYPWGDEAFARARAEDRPILLSVGYAACHWCHVMEHESFEDDATAALMNEHFVCVKVDREERPDVDAVYMDAVVAFNRGHGGWPMTVFLLPDGRPFFGGTYYPPEPRHGMPSFRQILQAMTEVYRDQRDSVLEQAQLITDALQQNAQVRSSTEPLSDALFAESASVLRGSFDAHWGGFGHAPKFPPASALEFLIRRGAGADMVSRTLDGMAAGGMYDVVGGGFHRYSVDEQWLVPHFEKMLYDNAQLVPVYLHAGRHDVVEQTVTYCLRELLLDGGGFASAQDADTQGVEGLTFTWTPTELVDAIGPGRDELLQPFEHGRYVLRGSLSDEERATLLAVRAERPQPLRDDKAIAGWNGLMLAALAEAGRRLGRDDWVRAAVELGEFLLGPLSTAEGRLHRTWRNGVAKGTGYLEDYANVAHGLYELHVATGDLRWLRESRRLALLAIDLFADEEGGGFFLTPRDGEELVARQKDLDDNPTPSGNSMLAYVLLRLARIWGDDELERRAVDTLRLVGDVIPRAPSAFGWALCALDLHLSPPRELAIIGSPGDAVARRALAEHDPNAVVAFGPADDIPLLAGKTAVDGKPALYVCERFACQAPVTA
jgi:uncharacterized protein YyaL (SSP411 family)